MSELPTSAPAAPVPAGPAPATSGPAPDPETLAFVTAQLAAAGITPSEEELARFATAYPGFRHMADLLHAVDDARYEVPGLHFTPTPKDTPWS